MKTQPTPSADLQESVMKVISTTSEKVNAATDPERPISGRYVYKQHGELSVHRKMLAEQAKAMDTGDQRATALGLSSDILIEEIGRRLHESNSTISTILSTLQSVQ